MTEIPIATKQAFERWLRERYAARTARKYAMDIATLVAHGGVAPRATKSRTADFRHAYDAWLAWPASTPLPIARSMFDGPRRPTLVERLWSRISTTGAPDACWPWTGSVDDHGYGSIREGRRSRVATRVLWEAVHGRALNNNECVCHSCDTPSCMNPRHLFVGTQADNVRDAVTKGRLVGPQRKRLSAEQRATLRAARAAGATHRELRERFNVGRQALARALREESDHG